MLDDYNNSSESDEIQEEDEYSENDYNKDDFEEDFNRLEKFKTDTITSLQKEENNNKTKTKKKVFLEDEKPPEDEKLIINDGTINFLNKMFNKAIQEKKEIEKLFDNAELKEFNHKKNFDKKHSRFAVDHYNLLIREGKYNKANDPYGWIYNENDEPINIHVSEELQATKTNKEIFDVVMNKLVKQKNKISLTSRSIPKQLFEILNIDVSKYTTD